MPSALCPKHQHSTSVIQHFLHLRPWIETRLLYDPFDGALPLNGLDVHALYAGRLQYLVDKLYRDLDAFLLLKFPGLLLVIAGSFFGLVHPVDESLRNRYAGNRGIHVLQHHSALRYDNTAKDRGPLMEAHVSDFGHLRPETFDIVNALGLDKVGPRIHLLHEINRPEIDGVRHGCP